MCAVSAGSGLCQDAEVVRAWCNCVSNHNSTVSTRTRARASALHCVSAWLYTAERWAAVYLYGRMDGWMDGSDGWIVVRCSAQLRVVEVDQGTDSPHGQALQAALARNRNRSLEASDGGQPSPWPCPSPRPDAEIEALLHASADFAADALLNTAAAVEASQILEP